MVRIIIYYYTKITFKGIVEKDIALLEKTIRKQKGKALTLRTRRQPYATRIWQKAAQRLKIKSAGIFFPKSCIYRCMGRFAKEIYRCFPERHKNYFKSHREVYDG